MGNMDKQNCSSDYYHSFGKRDSSKFGEPLPWIGLYVAAASLACLLLMTVDLLRSIRRKKYWIPSKFFAFNAATLTLLAVATKLPSDVTGAMPGLVDQFAKLSGIIILCVAMNHAMPSLGAMDGVVISSNMIALGIMVVSMFVNIWLQLSTGLIDKYKLPYVFEFSSICMLLLLLFLLSHSLTVPASRRILYRQYCEVHEEILREISSCVDVRARFSDGKLEEYICKYWLMALTSSPDYTLRSSELSHASLCLNVALFGFPFISVYTLVKDGKLINAGDRLSCLARSDYSWSTSVILLVQVLAIAIGFVISFFRGFNSDLSISRLNILKNEKYRYALMKEWKDRPLPVWISNKRFRQAVRNLRAMLLGVLIFLQFLVITLSRIIVLIFIFVGVILIIFRYLYVIFQKCFNRRDDSTTNAISNVDMSRYVLYLGDKEDKEQSKSIAQKWQNHPTTWIDRGRANQPTNLDRFLRSNPLPEAFEAVREFYSIQDFEAFESSRERLKCWALPIVTLASLLYATSPRREELMLAVRKSLRYVRLVDRNVDERGTGIMQKAVDILWDKLQKRWLDVDFDQTNSLSFSDLIFLLGEEAQEDIQQDGQGNNSEYWRMTGFMVNYLYTTTEINLGRQTDGSPSNLAWSVERLEKVMVGLLGACLTNLPLAIFKHCSSGTFGLREEKVREAATILGETRTIITLMEETGRVVNYPENKEYFESWVVNYPV